jgi:IS1 family transposase
VVVCQKKEAHLSALEKLAARSGDQWVWIGFDPRQKVVIHFVVGRHNQANANALVAGIKRRSDGHIPLFTSDELKHYDEALLASYGIKHEFARTGERGRPRKPVLRAPKNLLYAQVVKRRKKGRVVEITTRVVFGTLKAVAAKLDQSPVSTAINTSFVERNNLTMRHQNRRLVRKTMAFSKKQERLVQQLHLSFAYYHFVKPHLSLRQKTKRKKKKYQERTPTWAAGLTDHGWTMMELFSRAALEPLPEFQADLSACV